MLSEYIVHEKIINTTPCDVIKIYNVFLKNSLLFAFGVL